jgi:hypothetical protein
MTFPYSAEPAKSSKNAAKSLRKPLICGQLAEI